MNNHEEESNMAKVVDREMKRKYYGTEIRIERR